MNYYDARNYKGDVMNTWKYEAGIRSSIGLVIIGCFGLMSMGLQTVEVASRTWVGSSALNWSVANGFNGVSETGDTLVFNRHSDKRGVA